MKRFGFCLCVWYHHVEKTAALKGENMADLNFIKRMAPFLVLEILKNHTDDTHGLKLTQVVELLEEDYGVTMERKAVSRILNDLYELTEISQAYSWKHHILIVGIGNADHRHIRRKRLLRQLHKLFPIHNSDYHADSPFVIVSLL